MQKLIFSFFIFAVAACGNGSSNSPAIRTRDTGISGTVATGDTLGASMMNADTAGMGQAR